MAWVFKDEGQYEKTLEWYQRALESKEKTLGKDHLSTLRIVNNIAGVFKEQGQYEKALGWYRRALDGMEKTLGSEHPTTLAIVKNVTIVQDYLSALAGAEIY